MTQAKNLNLLHGGLYKIFQELYAAISLRTLLLQLEIS